MKEQSEERDNRKLDCANHDSLADISNSISLSLHAEITSPRHFNFGARTKRAQAAVILWFLHGVTDPFGESMEGRRRGSGSRVKGGTEARRTELKETQRKEEVPKQNQ